MESLYPMFVLFVEEQHVLLPTNIKYATHRNSERDAINTAVFQKHCLASAERNNGVATDCILIFSDNLVVKTQRNGGRALKNRSLFWQGCGENDIKVNGLHNSERVDPVLKLFFGCEIMLTKNENVLAAKANGTRAILTEIALKPGEECFFVSVGQAKVPAVYASSVKSATFKHVNKDARPTHFSLVPMVGAIKETAKRVSDSVTNKERTREELKIGIAGFYDRSSQLWESVWGEHMHHGKQHFDSKIRSRYK